MLIVRRPSIAPLAVWVGVIVVGVGLLALAGGGADGAPSPSTPAAAQLSNPDGGDVGAPCSAGLGSRADDHHWAAWARRCRGRVVDEWVGPVRVTGTEGRASLLDIELTAGVGPGVTPDVGGFVVVQADAWARAADGCPCPVALALRDQTEAVAGRNVRGHVGQRRGAAAISTEQVFPINAGETKSFAVVGEVLEPERADVDYVVRLTALFVPVAAESDNTLAGP